MQSSTVLYLGSYKVVGEVENLTGGAPKTSDSEKKKPKIGYRQRIDICTSSVRFQPVTFLLQAAQLPHLSISDLAVPAAVAIAAYRIELVGHTMMQQRS